MEAVAESYNVYRRDPSEIEGTFRIIELFVHSRPGTCLALLASPLLFLAAKNISSSNEITIDQFEYWIVGIVPAFLWLYTATKLGASKFGIYGLSIWLFSLIAFLAIELTQASELFPISWRLMFPFMPTATDGFLSIVCVLLATVSTSTIAAAIGSFRIIDFNRIFAAASLAVFSNALAFYFLLFVL